MDMSQYRGLFVSEARSHLNAFIGLIVRLEDTSQDRAAIDELFRHAHSLKGMAATMGFDPISRLAHVMESRLSTVRSGEASLTAALADLLLAGSDALALMIGQVEEQFETISCDERLIETISAFTADSPPLLQKNDASLTEQVPATAYQARKSDSFTTVRIRTEILDQLVNITGELITTGHRLSETARHSGHDLFDEPLHELFSLLRKLRDEVLKARMLPFGIISERFPRLVRDLARKQGKEISFHLEGHDIELDRGVLEEIAEPLVHILRNAVDHGMETPDDRVAAGKPYNGAINMTVVRDKDHVEIVIADDGRGMSSEHLKSHALHKGIISEEQAATMTSQESFQLICVPGFSTAATVSDVSGRGVGMDAVRSAVHTLGGTLAISSDPGLGSRFVVRLPITISIIHALMVRSGKLDIAIPVSAVCRTVELADGDIFEESGRNVIVMAGTHVPVRNLSQLTGQPLEAASINKPLPTVVCETGGKPLAVIVDHIYGQQEIFVRPLVSPLALLRGISGASITGDGRIVFIADVAALV